MPAFSDLLEGRFEGFTHASILALVREIGTEGSRIDVKGPWPANVEVAVDACALANAYGGIIVVGVGDEKLGFPLEHGVDTTDAKLTGVENTIASVTWPPVRVETKSFHDDATGHDLAVLVVWPASGGPHEHMTNGVNLPRRRGRRNDRLRYGEIVELQQRAGLSAPREYGPQTDRLTSLNGDMGSFYGIEILPAHYGPPARYVREDDDAFQRFWATALQERTTFFTWGRSGVQIYVDADLELAPNARRIWATAHADGSSIVRMSPAFRPDVNEFTQFLFAAKYAIAFGAFVLLRARQGPRARIFIRTQKKQLPNEPPRSLEAPLELGKMPGSFFADYDVDYSTFDESSARRLVGTIVEDLDRATGRSRARAEIDDAIRNFDLSDMFALLRTWP